MKDPRRTFLLILAAFGLYLCYLIARPFLAPVFLAFVLAIVFHPVHARILARVRRPNTAALLSTVLVLLVLLLPAAGLGIAMSREMNGLYLRLSQWSAEQGGWLSYLNHALEPLQSWLGRYVDPSVLDLRSAMLRWVGRASDDLLAWGAHAVGNLIGFLIDAAVACLTLFILFRRGGSLKERAAEIVPLSRDQFERLYAGISTSIIANVHGSLAVGAAQGCLAGLAFWALGVPSPVLWGALTALFSLVPIVGSAAIWGPAAVILMIDGHGWRGLILLVWGAGIVAQADNVIRPYMISGKAGPNTLLVFFALLGGVDAFGALGVFIGPIVLSVTHVVLQMLRETNQAHGAAPRSVVVAEEASALARAEKQE